MPSWQPRGQASPQFDQDSEEDMGKKIQYIGRYVMDGRTLGKGNFARVELATHGVTSIKVAIKVIDTRKIKEDYVRQNLHREARIMAQLRHPNIIRLYETLKATTLYCLVMEYACGGELLTYIKDQKDSRLTESAARPFFRQLLSALQYLHERGVVHRDLKMENILLDEKKKNIKLVDFGLSNVYSSDQPLKTHCGSPEYAAPELFQTGRTYGPEIDIWSLGIITYAMVVGKLPFIMGSSDEYHRRKLLQQIQKGLSKQHEREMQYLSADYRGLIQHLIEPSPHRRLPLSDVTNHPWVTRHGKLPFASYLAPPKDKALRAQVVVELASLMEMEKKAVSESVKEHRADELSAMFNMLVDEKKRQRGVFDADHTIRRVERFESRTATRTRAVGAKGKTDQPGLVKRSVANKLHVPVEHHVTVPSAETSQANAGPAVKEHNEQDPGASTNKDSLQPDLCSDLSKHPAHTTSGPSTRIPKRHATPTHKLNLTLDLSVVNVPASSRTDSPCQGTRSSGSSLCRSRVQSPSKIPMPRPGVDSQITSPDGSSTSSNKTKRTCLPLPRPHKHDKSARPARPTSLHFRGSKAGPQPRHPAFQGKGAANALPEPLVAPKATPEDSNVTSSASEPHLESMQCEMLNASDDEKLEKLEQLKHALLGSCMPRHQSTSDNTCDDSVNVNHKVEPAGRLGEVQAAQRTHKPLTRQFVRVAPVSVKACWSPSKETSRHKQCENHSGDLQSRSHTETSTPQAKGRSNSVAQYSGEEEVKDRSPSPHSTAGPALLPPSSSNGLPQYQDCLHVCSSHGNEALSSSPPHYEECMHTSQDKVSGSGENVEVSNTPEGMSSVEVSSAQASPVVARICTTCGSRLPPRPQKLFTSGAHALDMFVSPEEASLSSQDWRTSGATTASGSPMQAAPLLRDSPSSHVSSQLPSVANKPQMQITSEASTAKSYSDDNLGSKSGSSKPANANRWSMPPPSPVKRSSPKKAPNRTSTGLRYRFSSSADRSNARTQANSIFTAVPDKSLRLEPVGAESEMPLGEPSAGNHITTSSQPKPENGKPVTKLTNRLRRGASCESNSPTVSSSSQRSTPSNSGHLVHRVPTPPLSPQPKPSPAPTKWVVMKQYDQQRKHTTWRQGLSHLLRRAKPNGAPSSAETKVEAKSNTNSTGSRRSRPKTREVYYRQLEAKWTAPASPSNTTSNSMMVTSSPVPSTSPSPQQPFFDIASSRTESPSPCRGLRPAITRDATKDKALLDAHNEEIVSLDTKLKLENSIESAIHKSLTLSNSLTSRLPLRHRAKVAQQSGPSSNTCGKRTT